MVHSLLTSKHASWLECVTGMNSTACVALLECCADGARLLPMCCCSSCCSPLPHPIPLTPQTPLLLLPQVKRLVCASAAPADSAVVLGVACRKSLAHKRMRSSIAQPRIMLLAGGLEAQPAAAAANSRGGAGGGLGAATFGGAGFGGGGAAAAAVLTRSSLSSFDSLLDQEQQMLAAAVERIVSFSPDVLLVERSVARWVAASQMLSLLAYLPQQELQPQSILACLHAAGAMHPCLRPLAVR